MFSTTVKINTPPARILIMRLGAIGDCLRVLPAVARLRHSLPGAHIAWAVEHWVHPVLAGHPAINRFHVLDRRELKAGWRRAYKEVRRFLAEVKAENYEVILDFHGRFKSGLLGWLARVPVRIGFMKGDCAEGNYFFTNVHVKLTDTWENRVLRFLHLLEPLQIATAYDSTAHGLHLDPQTLAQAQHWYAQADSPPVAAYPGTSAKRERERWPENKWIELLRRLGEDGVRSVVFWGPAERELCNRIAAGAGPMCQLAPNTTLPEMMAMIRNCKAFIGSDTAAMHMAWMQGVPTAVFLGPKPTRTIEPLPPVRSRVLRAMEHYVEGRRTRKQKDEVVTAVTVDTAHQAVHELLAGQDTKI
ncbi:MAG TPA: glycosyltransferase family 9 protein [Gammaproteobacteria bacterium]